MIFFPQIARLSLTVFLVLGQEEQNGSIPFFWDRMAPVCCLVRVMGVIPIFCLIQEYGQMEWLCPLFGQRDGDRTTIMITLLKVAGQVTTQYFHLLIFFISFDFWSITVINKIQIIHGPCIVRSIKSTNIIPCLSHPYNTKFTLTQYSKFQANTQKVEGHTQYNVQVFKLVKPWTIWWKRAIQVTISLPWEPLRNEHS